MQRRWWLGEFVGTFLLVFFGCGSLAAAITTGVFSGIAQVALVWGVGIAIAIHVTGGLSGAHLNPAVTIGFWISGRFPMRGILPYAIIQFLGSFFACCVLYLIFQEAIDAFEIRESIVRGQVGSERSAMIFTEFFPNPSIEALQEKISMSTAIVAEIFGTFVLMFVILSLTDEKNQSKPNEMTALFIGLTVSLLICLLGPITMACLNPARDLAPRIFTFFMGWGGYSFSFNGYGWFAVYVVSPILGAGLGAWIYRYVFARQLEPPSSANSSA